MVQLVKFMVRMIHYIYRTLVFKTLLKYSSFSISSVLTLYVKIKIEQIHSYFPSYLLLTIFDKKNNQSWLA